MGARPSRLIDSALDFIVQQIHVTWQNKYRVVTLLSLNMTGAFDWVVPAQLLYNMRERKIIEWILKGVGSFIRNRTMTLSLPGYNTDTFPTHTGIPQDTPLSLIFILFYNANLVDACKLRTFPTSGICFVDDVNASAFARNN
jgi:hypothetical protein